MVKAPQFTTGTIQRQRDDGYWIDKFQYHEGDQAPGLIVSGLNSGKVQYLENPLRTGTSSTCEPKKEWVHVGRFASGSVACGSQGGGSESASEDDVVDALDEHSDDVTPPWKCYQMAHLDTPVPTASLDITGNGYSDVIVGYEFGNTMIDCDPRGGKLVWFENPGSKGPDAHWKEHYIGRWPAMHRLVTGYFTQRSFPEIIAAPVVHGPKDKHTPAPIICFQAPSRPDAPEVYEPQVDACQNRVEANSRLGERSEWRKDIVDDQHFRVVHEIYAKRFDGPSGLDSLIVASMEGVHWLYFRDGRWQREHITTGEPRKIGQRADTFSPGAGDMWGSGSADAGRIGSNPFAYVASIDPFHGPKVCAYTRSGRELEGNLWKRHVLDVYGTPAQKRLWGDGPGHQVICADIDGDGDDEFLVSLFGPLDRDNEDKPTGNALQSGENPNKGIICYKAIDLDKGIFAKWHIATRSSARCTVGNFAGSGAADIASISYNVEHYYQELDPKVTLYKNHLIPSFKPQITGSLWSDEGMVYLPRPTSVTHFEAKVLIEVANFAISVEVYPPKESIHAPKEDGIKPIYGSVVINNCETRAPLGGPPFPAKEDLSAHDGKRTVMKADSEKGAIILRLTPIQKPHSPGPWKKAVDVPVRNVFDISEQGLTFPDLSFTRGDDLCWGAAFKGVDFYNMTGFHFRFLDDKQNIAHMQFWTAGPNVDARLHDHSDNAFKELHTCLSQGTPNGPRDEMGGMWAPVSTSCPPCRPKGYPRGYGHCPLKPLEEHGRIWHEDDSGQAVYRRNNTVSYPPHAWHAGTAPEGYIDVWMALEFDAWLDL
ncbi:Aldos-2-ulose dehydratase [Fusarium albosuccineum]|uniref:Aldos-2-ulose dehydratase n=1 Tax=Fusarium albosuccineum TaxID=1237068 RepID=A0A8H4LIM6_9HYPO|nr:Aldos-2-ulose dehydratase [Fusarium albosuccineum]